jgi:endonuclease YncB( thermonuclease family)
MILTALAAAAIAVCPAPGTGVPARHHCVHDGDTVWWQGEKIRIADIDTPELTGRCDRERRLARAARTRLVVLLNTRPVTITRTGRDRYGRTLAVLGKVGDRMIAEGLATRWPNRRDWCPHG